MKNLLFFFLVFITTMQSQTNISGVVTGGHTKNYLAFSSIKSSSGNDYISDIDGKFSFVEDKKIEYIIISHLGFESEKIILNNSKSFFLVNLFPTYFDANINESNALKIIQQAVANKNTNDPEKKLKSFTFKSYNRLLITANPDSLKGKIDSVFVEKNFIKTFVKIDSSEYKFKKIIEKQHLFETEKVSNFEFIKNNLKETVIGLKMSGFKQPVYEILGFNLQSFSVYDNHYELFKTSYKNPISNDVVSDYSYKLLDTIPIKGRSTFAIYFKNRKKVNESGIEGLLYIDTENFAIAKSIMRVKNVLDITGIHEFDYYPEEKIWFPSSKTFKIVKGKNNEDIKLFGGTIQFDADELKNEKPREKHSSDYVYIASETKNSDIKFNEDFVIKKAAIAIEVKNDAVLQKPEFWNIYSKENFDYRSKKTYLTLDTLVLKRKVEKKFLFGKKFINGFVPISFFDLDLRKFFNFNNYEGFRFCLGGVTNEKLSKIFRIEGYTAYGTKDGNYKYNIGTAFRIGNFSDTWVGTSYTDDIQEIASTSFAIDKKKFKLIDTDLFNFSSFYNYKKSRVFLETKIIPKTESIWEIAQTNVDPKFAYQYKYQDRLYQNFNMTTAMVSMQWNPFSNYLQTPNGRIETEEGFPKFNFQITKTLPGILSNDFDFGKIDMKTIFERKFLNGQQTNLVFAFGYAFGDVPLTHLYNNSPNSLNKNKLLQRTTLEGDNDFETMYFNEFFSNKYAFFEIRHALKKFNFSKKFKPYLVFITRTAIGNIDKPDQHLDIEYKTLKNGYFESGLQINQLFKGLGISTFLRYGPNQLPDLEDNIALRISYYVDLGF